MSETASRLTVSLSGAGVTPETVDTRLLLEAATAYFDGLTRWAEDEDIALNCTGIEIVSGSAGLACKTDEDPDEIASSFDEATRSENPPAYIREIGKVAARALDRGQHLSVISNTGRRWEIGARAAPPSMRVRISARVRVIRAGGATPAIRVEHVLQGKRFTVTTSKDEAKKLAGFLYREIDLIADVEVNADRFLNGSLIAWYQLDDDQDAVKAWDEWFAPHAEHWRGLSADERLVELERQK